MLARFRYQYKRVCFGSTRRGIYYTRRFPFSPATYCLSPSSSPSLTFPPPPPFGWPTFRFIVLLLVYRTAFLCTATPPLSTVCPRVERTRCSHRADTPAPLALLTIATPLECEKGPPSDAPPSPRSQWRKLRSSDRITAWL